MNLIDEDAQAKIEDSDTHISIASIRKDKLTAKYLEF